MTYNYFDLKEKEGVAVVTIDRPPANAISSRMIEEIFSIGERVSSADDIRAVIFTGSGDFFSGGADIKMMEEHKDKNLPAFIEGYTVHLQRAYNMIEDIPKPIIAAINGFALGGGCELALACDFRFMAKGKARIGLPEVKLGLLPGGGGLQRLPRIVGKARAIEIIVNGRLLKAEEALEIGLVHRIFEPDELADGAFDYAVTLAKQATLAIGVIKRCINFGLESNIKAGLAFDIDSQDMLFHSEDGMEGITAFIEKRKPVFKGK